MATLPISDELYLQIQRQCERLGRGEEDVLSSALESLTEQELAPEPELTEIQIERMRESIAQLKSGEVVTSEEVDIFFELVSGTQRSSPCFMEAVMHNPY